MFSVTGMALPGKKDPRRKTGSNAGLPLTRRTTNHRANEAAKRWGTGGGLLGSRQTFATQTTIPTAAYWPGKVEAERKLVEEEQESYGKLTSRRRTSESW